MALQQKSKKLKIEADSLKLETRLNDKERKEEIENIKKYTEIAKLGVFGGKMTYIGKENNSILENSAVIENMKIALKPNGEKVDIIVSEEAVEAALKVVEIEPLFPFSYWVLTHNYARKNDIRCIITANKAIKILEQTTKINGHKPHHDTVLEWLYNFKKNNKLK